MDHRSVFLLQLAVYLGWILVGLMGLVLLVWGAFKRRRRRFVIGAILIVAAPLWLWLLLPVEVGWNYSEVRSPDGKSLAYIRRTGMFTNRLIVERAGRRWEFRLPASSERPDPERVFWLPSGQAIGVEYDEAKFSEQSAGSRDLVLEVFPIPKDPHRIGDCTDEQMEDWKKWVVAGRRRKPTDEETKYFRK